MTTWIARHSKATLDAGHCSRKALRFEAESNCSAPFISGMYVRCPDCERLMSRIDAITGVVREEKECNARCIGATTGGVCECKCGGENHGGAHALEEVA